ncbi:MAG TPA: hypothetical protein DCL29_02165 [Eubacterium sp.]|nr:hypothetical protein [Eubacterium sp.]
MAITKNNTLPLNWDSTYSYNKGDTVSSNGMIYTSLVQGNLGHQPAKSSDYWEVLDIYKKDMTNMPHGEYGGDDNFWERDNIYIDTNGWIYVNNENTGINVKGRDGTITFESLTPEQIEALRGPRGERGEQGPAGPEGPQGPMGEVILTPEQTAALKGDQGKSAYDIWIEQGHTGTEEDFLNWLTEKAYVLDTSLLPDSINPVENKAIYNALFSYQVYLTSLVEDYGKRITALENRLKAIYNGEEQLFTFGVTDLGSYGYIRTGDTQVIPFDATSSEGTLQSGSAFTRDMVATMQYAHQEVSPVNITVADWDGVTKSASYSGTASEDNDLDSGIAVYGSNVKTISFEDYADAKLYLYREGRNISAVAGGFSQYSMTTNQTNISSNNEEDIEGIITGISTALFGHTFCVKVAPATAGTTINYQIGLSSADSSLPTVISTGDGRSTYVNGSFSEETVISYPTAENYKNYFASTSSAEYIIKEVYVE